MYLHDQVGIVDTDTGDADAGDGCAVGCSEAWTGRWMVSECGVLEMSKRKERYTQPKIICSASKRGC